MSLVIQIILGILIVGLIFAIIQSIRRDDRKLIKALRERADAHEEHAEAEVSLRQTYERYVIELRALWEGISDAMDGDETEEEVDALCARFAAVLESIARVAEEPG